MNKSNTIYTIDDFFKKKKGAYSGGTRFQKFILPILKIIYDGIEKRDKIYSEIEKRMNLDSSDLKKHFIKQEKETKYREFEYTALWSIYHLRKNNLVMDIKSGLFKITKEGKEFVKKNIFNEKISLELEKKLISEIIEGTKKKIESEKEIEETIDEEDILDIESENLNDEERFKDYQNNNRIKILTFHQSYSYEEFIEGISFKEKDDSYFVKDGFFKNFCKEAIWSAINQNLSFLLEKNMEWSSLEILKRDNSKGFFNKFFKLVKELSYREYKELFSDSPKYILIIDEINRGNISKIFGELITLLEKDKRLSETNEIISELPYSREKFGIPPNLYIIGTMNTSDKSIAQLDLALRRRFGFVEILPEPELLDYEIHKQRLEQNEVAFDKNLDELYGLVNLQILLEKINKRIEFLLDKDHTIGHSYFMNVTSIEDLKEVFYNEIIPLLEEYFYGDSDKLKLVLGDSFFEKSENASKYFKSSDEVNKTELIKLKRFENVSIDDFKKSINNLFVIKEIEESKDEN